MTRHVPLLLLAALITLASLPACRCHRHGDSSEGSQRSGAGGADGWLMRSYEVPADDAAAVLSQLRDLFVMSKGDKDGTFSQIARANLAPDGKLVVLGDEGVQQGVKDLLAGMAGQHVALPTLTITHWLVSGRPAKADSQLPSDLKPLADALHEISTREGAQEFALWERLEIVSNGTPSFLQGRHSTIHDDAVALGGKVFLSTRIGASHLSDHMLGPNNIDTKLEIAPDQIVLLAETGFNPSEPINAQSGNDPPGSLYYLVKASVRNADSRPR